MNATPAETDERTGGCLCGKIRFVVKGKADYPHTCSCPHCQRLGGAPVMWWAGFATDGLSWTGEGGEPKWFETFPGQAKRAFCPDCGSRIAALDSDIPDIGINVTALDDTSGADLVPVNQSFRDSAVHWLPSVPDTQHSTVAG
ncbi:MULTISPECIES: GFA family protein [unclassified Streptomyces]|uniref:GFA family protein n=1 Tax=Streptomyces TaxID=1883 RepID=UPI0002FC2F04|nr:MULTISPECIES: GFA family protein [unclassified Streptomyces]MDF4249572.1 GFA family protein [Streptomyces sp. WMMB303]